MSEHILVQREGATVRVVLNRPEKRNALSGQMRDEMTHAMKRAEAERLERGDVGGGQGGAVPDAEVA